MASLMEELIAVLQEENAAYEKLVALSMKKTPVIISADLEALAKITEDEQEVINHISRLDKRRDTGMKDIANVINMDVNGLKLGELIAMLDKRPAEQKKLAEVYDKLVETISQMKRVNEQNRTLLESSLEMIQFDMNILQAYKGAPETANYDSSAYNAGMYMGSNRGAFDAKQ